MEGESLPFIVPGRPIDVRSRELGWRGADIKQAVRRVADFHELGQVFNRGIEESQGRSEMLPYCLTACQANRCPTWANMRFPSGSNSVKLGRCQGGRYARITRNQPTFGRAGENYGLQARNNGLGLALRVVPGLADFPAKP